MFHKKWDQRLARISVSFRSFDLSSAGRAPTLGGRPRAVAVQERRPTHRSDGLWVNQTTSCKAAARAAAHVRALVALAARAGATLKDLITSIQHIPEIRPVDLAEHMVLLPKQAEWHRKVLLHGYGPPKHR